MQQAVFLLLESWGKTPFSFLIAASTWSHGPKWNPFSIDPQTPLLLQRGHWFKTTWRLPKGVKFGISNIANYNNSWIIINSPIKHASRAPALRADGVHYTMGLALTQPNYQSLSVPHLGPSPRTLWGLVPPHYPITRKG